MSSAYDKLHPSIQKWVRDQGWSELRPIQVEAINAYLTSKDDQIISASTAGGKTEAAFLPAISEALTTPVSGFSILYISPLKALINDQSKRLADMCRNLEFPAIPWHGDISASVKARALVNPSGIVLITPESLEAMLIRRGLEIPRLFGALRLIVIDELHAFLGTERGVQLRSLLARLRNKVGRTTRLVGLSATLGDMQIAQAFLRPDAPDSVRIVKGEAGRSEIQIRLQGYRKGDTSQVGDATAARIADHLFERLRGTNNLVFAGRRQSVEIYADGLRQRCEDARLPNEFFPHHASLSKDDRETVEQRLKAGRPPTTAICTSTLELGIDIGEVKCVAQIGAPFSVSSLRQRLGRSGRREGVPAILRQYAIEQALDQECDFSDRLRLRLFRTVAMIELLLENWCEPTRHGALHLSTLVHQILATIAQEGGVSAQKLYRILCAEGAFNTITPAAFADTLRCIGGPDAALIEQADDGTLLLGKVGERLVEHYSFYTVFQTPEEFRLISFGKELGTIPIDNIVSPGTLLIFSGRRWVVNEVHERERVISVSPAKGGIPPKFGGDPGNIDDKVIQRMFDLYRNVHRPIYLDPTGIELLDEGRSEFLRLGFNEMRIVRKGETSGIFATIRGTVATTTLALALKSIGATTLEHDGFIEFECEDGFENVIDKLKKIAKRAEIDLFTNDTCLVFEKFHQYLSRALLEADALSSRLDRGALVDLCEELLENFSTTPN